MNKNIKDEFDSLINSQTPDLWERIEMSLPEKTILSERTNGEEKKNAAEQISPAIRKSEPVKHRLYRKYAAYGTAGIAACLCITLVALNNSFKKSEENMTADESAAEEILLDDAETEGAVEDDGFMMDGGLNGAYDGAMEDFADTAEYEKEAASAEAAGDEAGEGAAAGTETAEAPAEEAKYWQDSEDVTDENRKEDLSSGKEEENDQAVQEKKEELLKSGYWVYEDAIIRIESVSETVQEEKNVIIYHVTLLEENVNTDKEIKLDLKTDELFRTKLVEGACYQVTFYDNKMPYDSSVHEYFLLELK